jgi:hypothetical protein
MALKEKLLSTYSKVFNNVIKNDIKGFKIDEDTLEEMNEFSSIIYRFSDSLESICKNELISGAFYDSYREDYHKDLTMLFRKQYLTSLLVKSRLNSKDDFFDFRMHFFGRCECGDHDGSEFGLNTTL